MALYAFDGTWNEDDDDAAGDTNVVKFRDAYQGGNIHYLEGVGTRFGLIGKFLGGVFGAGGKTRIEEMYDKLCENWEAGDETIDVIGFSRGAALAVHFTNVIDNIGICKGGDPDAEQLKAKPEVRFLGLWDIVASFGIPRDIVFDFQKVNIGYDITVPDIVARCAHAMALDERRASFRVTRLDQHNQNDSIEELWFRGVHSDVGGGSDKKHRLSGIALKWMMDDAIAQDVPLNPAAIPTPGPKDNQTKLGENFDLIENARRKFWPNDKKHHTALGVELQPGDPETFHVYAKEHYSWTGIRLVKGATYSFTVADDQSWIDKQIKCGADGWTSRELPWIKERFAEWYEDRRRVPKANWFELIGSLDDDGDDFFRIGKSLQGYVAPEDADLYAFANDLDDKYGNNKGKILVSIKRMP